MKQPLIPRCRYEMWQCIILDQNNLPSPKYPIGQKLCSKPIGT